MAAADAALLPPELLEQIFEAVLV
eukprot:SAG22_NODE_19395_length_275_cov_0.857955_1_plen_23_part_01